MSGSVNKAWLIGRVGKDPESRNLQGGDSVVNLSLATSESWKDQASGEKKERTQWHQIVSFNQGLNKVFMEHVGKGDLISIIGQIETRNYEKDGQKVYTTEIVLRPFSGELTLLTKAGNDSAGQDSYGAPSP